MTKLKSLITISIINIMMFHFNIHWGDIFEPLKAYEYFGHSLSLKNNFSYQILLIKPNSKIKINNQNRKLTFQSYDRENNRILVIDGNNSTTYDLSEIKSLSCRLDPDILTLERLLAASGASVLGGILGGAAMSASIANGPQGYDNGGGFMLGCMGGMAVSPVLYLTTVKGKWLELSLDQWSVQ